MKKSAAYFLIFILTICACSGALSACSGEALYSEGEGGLKVLCTVFAPFDFACEVGGDSVTVTLLQDNGADLHNYTPTADTLSALSDADVFIYIGGVSDEGWVQKAIKASGNTDIISVCLMDSVEQLHAELENDWSDHAHGDSDRDDADEAADGLGDNDHDDDHDNGDDHSHDGHNHEGDEHIWTSLENAKRMVAAIADAFVSADAAAAIGIGLQSFCIPGSVAENRKVGLGHGNLGKMLLSEETECFCFLAGHESFAAAEGAIKIALNANKVRTKPLRVILNGLGKDAAYIISRINGFTYVETKFDPYTEEVTIVREVPFSKGPRANVRCYGSDNVPEGVAIMKLENVGVSITGNSTNPTRFQHPVAGTYKKWAIENGVSYFSVASGGGTGRTLHPDNMAAGPSSYGMTDTMGRMHSDAQFAGSSSVPAHVEMMGLIGAGNNPMVGMTVAVAVAIEEASK